MKSPEESLRSGETVPEPTRKLAAQVKYLRAANVILTIALLVALFFLFLIAKERTRLQQGVFSSEKKNLKLESSLALLSGDLSGSPAAHIGDVVPPFEAIKLDGQKVGITYDGGTRRLLFIFSPLCSACIEELPKWNRITKLARSSNYSVFGVSLKPAEVTKTSLSELQPSFDVLIMPNMAVQRAYRVVAEPVVILISPQGTIDWAYYGGLNEPAIAELSSILQARHDQ